MAYQNTTIRDLIMEKLNRNTFLPAIQREYVWTPAQVEKLFDSLMSGYPISSFLFWKVREERKNDWISYRFLQDYDQQNPHNDIVNMDGVNQDIYFVLDGQQRITSLNIALKGSYRYFYRKWHKTRLYLNLLWQKSEDDPEAGDYQFLFKEDEKPIEKLKCNQLWYRVGDILNYDDEEDAKDACDERLEAFPAEVQKRARKLISRLFSVINVRPIINYYEEKTDDYDKVLEIFIRTNTGGQKLEYSDILLSTATAQWAHLNAREEINSFTDEINNIGTGYNFGKDFVMKGAMYLTENLPVQYKLSSFTQKNLESIEEHWEETKQAIRESVQLVSSFGFQDRNLVSRLPLLPIARYLLNKKCPTFLQSSSIDDMKDKNNIQKWLVITILKSAFGSSSDAKLTLSRKVLDTHTESFPYKEINEALGVESSFNDGEIKALLQTGYKTRYSFSILSLLYPDRNWKDTVYNEDHIYPRAGFFTKNLRMLGYDEETISKYLAVFNTVLNLELLGESENKSKNATPFEDWIKSRDAHFKSTHQIPAMNDYSMDHFLEFIEARRELLTNCIRQFNF